MYKNKYKQPDIDGSEKSPVILTLRDNTDLVYVPPDISLCSYQHVYATIINKIVL